MNATSREMRSHQDYFVIQIAEKQLTVQTLK